MHTFYVAEHDTGIIIVEAVSKEMDISTQKSTLLRTMSLFFASITYFVEENFVKKN